MQVDSRGLELTTSSEGAAKNIDQAVTDYLDYRTTASGHVKAALEHLSPPHHGVHEGSLVKDPR